jgi:hypothetical protein
MPPSPFDDGELYDTRTFCRVEPIRDSVNEVEFLDEHGAVREGRRSEFSVPSTYKSEMEP